MVSKAIQRTLLIVALVATAHLLKPFSLRNVATHLIHSATSFSFILPDSAAGSLEQANYLATALDNGFRMMEARQESSWTQKGSVLNETAFTSNLMPPQTQSDNVRSFTAVSPCRDAAKTVTKTLAKAKPRAAKKLIAMSVAKPVEKPVEKASAVAQALAVSLPALEIEKVIAVNLSAAKAQLPSIPSVSPTHHITAANFIVASPRKSCQMEEIKPQPPLSRAEAEQQRLRASIQQLVYTANSVKMLCAKERIRARKGIPQISVKPC
jgi:hypothetical protein